jgi:CheY-like chemotaxis protein
VGKELKECSILLVDDDAGDRLLIHKAIQENGVGNRIEFLEDGQALVDHLTLHARAPGAARPCLILLDLNMPRLDGHEALKIVRNHSSWKEIPIVVLSNSGNSDDILNSYREGANSFFTKPFEYKELVRLMGLLKTYWFETAKLPFQAS